MEHRAYKRNRIRKDASAKRKKWVNAAAVIASIALIAAIVALSPAGDWMNEHIVRPVAAWIRTNDSDERIAEALKAQDQQAAKPTAAASPAASPEDVRVLTAQETPFYLLQMGAFMERGEAEKHAEQIRQMGAGGTIMEDGPVFRVMAAAYRDEESLMQVQSQVRGDGFEATPYITDQNAVKITLKGNQTAVKNAEEAIGFLSEVPGELTNISLQFDRAEIGKEEVFKKIEAFADQAETLSDSLKNVNNDTLKPVVSIILKYQESISTFLQNYDSISEREIASALKSLQIETILHYIRFFDQK